MGLKVRYNTDGSITVQGGDEEVTVCAHPGPAALGSNDEATPSEPETPVVVGPPATGPRVMIRLPGYEDRAERTFSALRLDSFIALARQGGPSFVEPATKIINVEVGHNHLIDVKTLLDSTERASGANPLDVQLWLMKLDDEA
jgi:hypothetical protein